MMTWKLPATLLSGAALALLAATVVADAAELRISGAATVAGRILVPNKSAIEQEIGAAISITVNGDGNGLKDLNAAKVDAAMIAAPIAGTAAILNKADSAPINAADFDLVPLGSTPISFITNPANPVKTLTEAQLRDILLGKITAWKDVGGPDQPIIVVAEAPGFGTHTTIVSTFLGGSEFTAKARLMQALVQVAQVVAQLPNAIGYGNVASITNAVTVLPGLEVAQPLGLATKGPRSAEVTRLIEAVSKYATPR